MPHASKIAFFCRNISPNIPEKYQKVRPKYSSVATAAAWSTPHCSKWSDCVIRVTNAVAATKSDPRCTAGRHFLLGARLMDVMWRWGYRTVHRHFFAGNQDRVLALQWGGLERIYSFKIYQEFRWKAHIIWSEDFCFNESVGDIYDLWTDQIIVETQFIFSLCHY